MPSGKFGGERHRPKRGGVELARQRDQRASQCHQIFAGGFRDQLAVAEIAAGHIDTGRRNQGAEPGKHLPQLGIDG